VQAHPNLWPQLRVPNTNVPKRLNLSAAEKAALAAFMKTLTERNFTTGVKFSTPFK
jgi:cytochrome c peroxidase